MINTFNVVLTETSPRPNLQMVALQ